MQFETVIQLKRGRAPTVRAGDARSSIDSRQENVSKSDLLLVTESPNIATKALERIGNGDVRGITVDQISGTTTVDDIEGVSTLDTTSALAEVDKPLIDGVDGLGVGVSAPRNIALALGVQAVEAIETSLVQVQRPGRPLQRRPCPVVSIPGSNIVVCRLISGPAVG